MDQELTDLTRAFTHVRQQRNLLLKYVRHADGCFADLPHGPVCTCGLQALVEEITDGLTAPHQRGHRDE